MIENYLACLEISMQLYSNKDNHKGDNQEINDNFEKYIELCYNELKKMSLEDKEVLKKILAQKIEIETTERTVIMNVLWISGKDKSLGNTMPGHILAQYSDKLKKHSKKMKFLQSSYEQLEMEMKKETPSITRK